MDIKITITIQYYLKRYYNSNHIILMIISVFLISIYKFHLTINLMTDIWVYNRHVLLEETGVKIYDFESVIILFGE